MTESIVKNIPSNGDTLRDSVLPNFCDVRTIFVVVLLTELLAMIFAMIAAANSAQFWDYLALSSLLMLWIALLNSAILCQLRKWLHKQKQSVCFVLAFCLMMGVSLLVSLLIGKAGLLFFTVFNDSAGDTLFLVRVMTISAVIYFLVLRYFYIQHQWRVNLAAQSRAEIQALQARIRPHFLFNSMNTIASLIAISPERAETAIEDLSDLFRASLSEKNMTSLADEIELTKSYLAIESLRLGDRLQINWEIDEKLLKTEVPSLSIQPLAENAIYHGIEPLEKGGKIHISALQIDNKLELSISNPLASENRSKSFKKGNQMAQDNIRQRLKLVYGNAGKFTINDTKDSYTVSLLIPLV
ncbi:Autolysis histidine kinase LytS [hydrothermal vent metagenome]|uniref:Autolysis histidine kinase LytS n=1 Tax=hydrothermal vent metagenome TaxID=652676 RepID=A0A3B0WWU9_9ZZZZ